MHAVLASGVRVMWWGAVMLVFLSSGSFYSKRTDSKSYIKLTMLVLLQNLPPSALTPLAPSTSSISASCHLLTRSRATLAPARRPSCKLLARPLCSCSVQSEKLTLLLIPLLISWWLIRQYRGFFWGKARTHWLEGTLPQERSHGILTTRGPSLFLMLCTAWTNERDSSCPRRMERDRHWPS